MPDPTKSDTPVHDWFGLSYSPYLVIPRLALQHMPAEWQRRFVELLQEAEESGLKTPGDYEVRRRVNGRYADDPWRDYRRGNVADLLASPFQSPNKD